MNPHPGWPCFILTPRAGEALGSRCTNAVRRGFQVETPGELSLEDGQESAQSKEGTPFAVSAVSFLPWPVSGAGDAA